MHQSQTEYQTEDNNTKTSGVRKFLAVLGILFVTAGIFLAAFGFSFKIMMFPKESKKSQSDIDAEVDRLKISVTHLEEENRRLKEENEILKQGSSGSSKSSSSNSSSSSSIESSGSSSNSTSGSSSSSSSSSSNNSNKSSSSLYTD